MKKVAILQSNYIPWKGYFDMIAMVDEFILYDDVQYTRSDWRNRNKIKTAKGLLWLTIPVGKHYSKINETTISKPDWGHAHWATLKQAYGKAAHFKEYKDVFENFYLNTSEPYLSRVNYQLIKMVNSILKIDTKISWSSDYQLIEGKSERLVDLVQQAGGAEYISGPAAKVYLQEDLFAAANIKVTWMDYSGYPEYPQLYPPFEHGVSVLDLIFNMGSDSSNFLKSRTIA
jgi:WbqC-like protein family